MWVTAHSDCQSPAHPNSDWKLPARVTLIGWASSIALPQNHPIRLIMTSSLNLFDVSCFIEPSPLF